MFDSKSIFNHLQSHEGIYYSKNKRSISYPESGNQDCFQLEESSFWFKHRNNCIKQCAKKYFIKQEFFDIGGGNGFVAKGLQSEGFDTVLLEPGNTGCRNAQLRGVDHVVCATLEDAGFAKNSIPNAGAFDVIEHIEDDLGFVNEIWNYLEPGGFFLATVPAYQTLWSNEDVDAGHFRRYSLSSLEELLKKANFQIEYSTYLFSPLPLPILLFRSVPSKLGLNKNSNSIAKHEGEHKERSGVANRILNKIWNSELMKVRKGKRIGLGSSCLVVARKPLNSD